MRFSLKITCDNYGYNLKNISLSELLKVIVNESANIQSVEIKKEPQLNCGLEGI